jgi:general secretion pathway protein H
MPCRFRAIRRQTGFTLLEMLVVVAVLGLVFALVAMRGPMRSQTLEARAAASQIAQELRLARSKAIATNGPARFVLDFTSHSFRIDSGPPTALPRSMVLAMTAVADETRADRMAAIRFNPDGSSSGGRIELTDGRQRVRIGVDWLTGHITVADARQGGD